MSLFGGGRTCKEYKGYLICKSVSHGYGFLKSGRGTIKTTKTWSVEDHTGLYYQRVKSEAEAKKVINNIHKSKR